MNYNSGQVSAFTFGGAQAGWNGGASGSIYGGPVYGLNDANSNWEKRDGLNCVIYLMR